MNKKYFILFIVLMIFILVIGASVSILNSSKNDEIKNKIKSELDYIEVKLLGMINSLNNIPFSNTILLEQNSFPGESGLNDSSDSGQASQTSNNNQENSSGKEEKNGNEKQESSKTSENNSKLQNSDYTKYNVKNNNILIEQSEEIDWDYIKNTVEELYTTWPIIMVDLHSIDIEKKDILDFSTNLDNLIIYIEQEDRLNVSNILNILYSYLAKYTQQYSDDSNFINTYYTKCSIVSTYVLVTKDEWKLVPQELLNAKEYFNLVINSVKQNTEQVNVSKAYILINEMNNIIEMEDKKLFYLKYKNLMECLMQI